MSYVPEFVALYEIIPYIEFLPLNNTTIRDAVKDYLEGGETRRNAIIKKYGPIRDWNTSDVTDMSYLFSVYNYFNQPIGEWNTSKVTNVEYMFLCCESSNQPICGWDTSNVINMEMMFNGAKSFNRENAPWYHE